MDEKSFFHHDNTGAAETGKFWVVEREKKIYNPVLNTSRTKEEQKTLIFSAFLLLSSCPKNVVCEALDSFRNLKTS
jgi:hypothetical protein